MEPPDTARAIGAVISIAVELDRAADDATVVQNSNKLFTDRVEEAQQIVARGDLTHDLADGDREMLASTLRRTRRAIRARSATEQLLHDEPHPGNVLSTADGLRFIATRQPAGRVALRSQRRHARVARCRASRSRRRDRPAVSGSRRARCGRGDPTTHRLCRPHRRNRWSRATGPGDLDRAERLAADVVASCEQHGIALLAERTSAFVD